MRGDATDGQAVGDGVQHDAVNESRRQTQRLLARFGREVDFARLDGMIAANMTKVGRFTLNAIERESGQV